MCNRFTNKVEVLKFFWSLLILFIELIFLFLNLIFKSFNLDYLFLNFLINLMYRKEILFNCFILLKLSLFKHVLPLTKPLLEERKQIIVVLFAIVPNLMKLFGPKNIFILFKFPDLFHKNDDFFFQRFIYKHPILDQTHKIWEVFLVV